MRHRYNRSWYTSYLSGANQLIAEAGAVNLFLQKIQLDDDGNATGEGPGVMELSPLGHVARDFSHFVRARSGHALLIYSVYITCFRSGCVPIFVAMAIVIGMAWSGGFNKNEAMCHTQ